jgi:hypothetical protein
MIQANVDSAAQEGAYRQHYGRCLEGNASHGDDPRDPVSLHDQIGRLLLKETQSRLVLQAAPNSLAVELSIRLGARSPHSGAFARIQRSKLNTGPVGSASHSASQRVDLSNQMALADTADGGIAAHLAQRFDALSQQESAGAHASSREGSLRAGMTTTDDDDVVGLSKTHM